MPDPRNSKPADTQEAQSARFIEAARELGCDESEEAFNEKLRKVAKAKVAAPEGDGQAGRKPKG